MHHTIYGFEDSFYKEHVQNTDVMLGLFTSGGTMANVAALWIARNIQLGPSDDGVMDVAPGEEAKLPSFLGVEKEVSY